MWTQPKSEHDYALRFPDWWEADVEAMVRKDRNHPSVIIYSIGNEIPEAGTPMGARVGRAWRRRSGRSTARGSSPKESAACWSAARAVRAVGRGSRRARPRRPGRGDRRQHRHDPDRRSAQRSHDVAGRGQELGETRPISTSSGTTTWNRGRHRRRALSEPGDRGERDASRRDRHGWAAVRRHPHVIGDFTWTGWDYLGEAGIGRTVYASRGRRPACLFPGRVPVADRVVRRHRHHRPPAPPVVLPRDRLRPADGPLPRRAAARASRRGRGRHPVVLERCRLELELARARGGAGHGRGLRRRRRGGAVGERPLRGPPAQRGGVSLPVGLRETYEPGLVEAVAFRAEPKSAARRSVPPPRPGVARRRPRPHR